MKPLIEVHAVNAMSAAQRHEVDDAFRAQFGHLSYQWAEPSWHVIARRDGALASCLRLFERVVSAAGQAVRVTGVGGVITRAEWRHTGLASAALTSAARFMKETLGSEFGLLICRPEVSPVYEQLGWQVVEGPTSFDQPDGAITYPGLTMALPCSAREWPGAPIDLCGRPW